ncbi:MAG TPA: NAD(P)/FAD-dependent oxidoreductase [Pyrinomonadaceae bacterium]|nr:NAD(P)/FAD-dependent oxidoreductase [Pyrinomonadaceae bacterium]
MASERFDVLIVGAGPAGSFAAEHLSRAGVRVALFDGRPAGEPKACGGGVTSKALKAWPHLLQAVGRMIDELEMYSPSGKRLHLKLAEPFAIYSRLAFDSYLRERARRAGAFVFAEKVSLEPRAVEGGEDWTVRGKGGAKWSAPMLVAADGANSPIAKKLAGPLPAAEMEVAFGYRTPLPKGGEAPAVVAFLPGWAGYAWAFPRMDHISFGIATAQDAFDHAALDSLLWDFMVDYYCRRADAGGRIRSVGKGEKARDELIREELSALAERYAARIPGLAVETWDRRRAAGEGWALLGDAAGFADPVTGEGIYYALRSAELFAEAYMEGRPLDYERRWRGDFGRELRRAAEMRSRFYGSFWGAPFTERMIEFARTHRGIRRVLGQLVAGDQGYVDLKRKLARRALWPL